MRVSNHVIVSFFAQGLPKPAGSKAAGVAHRRMPDGSYEPVRNEATGRLKTFVKDSSGAKGKAWREDVRSAAIVAMAGRPPAREPLALSVIFHLPRPKGHYGTGRNAYRLKETAPRFHTGKPDVTKLLRSVEDAMLQVVYVDDSQVVAQMGWKPYSEDGRVGATISLSYAELGAEYWLAYEVPLNLALAG